MFQRRNLQKFGVVAVLLGVLLLATAAPAIPAQPEAANVTLSTSPVWADHSCPADVTVALAGDPVDVGGYETQVNFDAVHFGYTSGNIALTDFLSDGGLRSTSGDDGTPFLEAIAATNVKFGDYSWGTSAGADSPGNLATVGLDVVACGSSSVSLSDSQVVDYLGTPFVLGTESSTSYAVYHLYDTNGDNLPFVTSSDVLAVVSNIGPWGGGCSAGYQYDTNLDGLPFITSSDVLAVVSNIGPVSCP
ncbi:MAG: hypothetical protein U9R25_19675 [Chloroflexota bacterium]|nr:hypothetical protein [Chloroflexota bacterium]